MGPAYRNQLLLQSSASIWLYLYWSFYLLHRPLMGMECTLSVESGVTTLTPEMGVNHIST